MRLFSGITLFPMGPSVRERKKSRTREDLIRAAVNQFQRQGFDATTVDDIVLEAGCSRSTFFRYFLTKEDVVFGNLPDRLRRFEEALDNASPNADPWHVAEQALRTNVLAFDIMVDQTLEAACVALWFKEPPLQRRYIEIVLEWETTLSHYFARARGVCHENDIVGKTMASALIGVGRAATQMQLSDLDAVDDAIERGYAALRQGFQQRV